MSYPNEDIEFCPTRANIDWSNIQFTDYSKGVAVADFSNIKYFEPSDSEAEAEEDQGEEEGDGQKEAGASGEGAENEDGRPPPSQSSLSKKAKQKAKKKAKAAAKAAKANEDDGEASKDAEEPPTAPPVEEDDDDKPSGKKGKGKKGKGKKNAKKNAKNSNNARSLPQEEASESTKSSTPEKKGDEAVAEPSAESQPTEDTNADVAKDSSEANPPPAAEEAEKSEPAPSSDPAPVEEPSSEPTEESAPEPAPEPAAEPEAEVKEESAPAAPVEDPTKDEASSEEQKEPEPEAQLEEETIQTTTEDPATSEAPGIKPVEEHKDDSPPPAAEPESGESPTPAPEVQSEETKEESDPIISESTTAEPKDDSSNSPTTETQAEEIEAPTQVEDNAESTPAPAADPEPTSESTEESQPAADSQPDEAKEADSATPAPETTKEQQEDSPAEPDVSTTQNDSSEQQATESQSAEAQENTDTPAQEPEPADTQDDSPPPATEEQPSDPSDEKIEPQADSTAAVSEAQESEDTTQELSTSEIPEAQPDSAENVTPEAESKDEADVVPTTDETNDSGSSQPEISEETAQSENANDSQEPVPDDTPAAEEQQEETPVAPSEPEQAPISDEAEPPKPQEDNATQEASEAETPVEEPVPAEIQEPEPPSDDTPSNEKPATSADDSPGEGEKSQGDSGPDDATKQDESPAEEQAPAPAQSESEIPQDSTPQDSVTEESSPQPTGDAPSDPPQAESTTNEEPATPSSEELASSAPIQNDPAPETHSQDVTEDDSPDSQPKEEPAPKSEKEAEPATELDGQPDTQAQPEPSSTAEEADSGDVPEPESPSAKQVRFAEDPEVITESTAQEDTQPPVEEQKEPEAASDDTAQNSTPAETTSPEVESAPSTDAADEKPSEEPMLESSSAEAESHDEAKTDEPEKPVDPESNDSGASPEISNETEEPESVPAEPEEEKPLDADKPSGEDQETPEETSESKETELSATTADDTPVTEPETSPDDVSAEVVEAKETNEPSQSENVDSGDAKEAEPTSNETVEPISTEEPEATENLADEPSNAQSQPEISSEEPPAEPRNADDPSNAEGEQAIPEGKSEETSPPVEEGDSESPKEPEPTTEGTEDKGSESLAIQDPPSQDGAEIEVSPDTNEPPKSEESPEEEQAAPEPEATPAEQTVEAPDDSDKLESQQEPEDSPDAGDKTDPTPENLQDESQGSPEADAPVTDNVEENNAPTEEPTKETEIPETVEPAVIEEADITEKNGDVEPPASPVDEPLKSEEPSNVEEQESQQVEETAPAAVEEQATDDKEVEASPEVETQQVEEPHESIDVQEAPAAEEPASPPTAEGQEPPPEDDESKDTLGPIPSSEKAAKADKGEDHPALHFHDTPGVGGNIVSNPIEESLLAEDVDDGGAKMDFTEDSNAVTNTAGLDGQTQSPPDEDEGGAKVASGAGSVTNDLKIHDDDEEATTTDTTNIDEALAAPSTQDDVVNTIELATEAPDTSGPMEDEKQSDLERSDSPEADNTTNEDGVSHIEVSTPLGAEASEGVPLSDSPLGEEVGEEHPTNTKETIEAATEQIQDSGATGEGTNLTQPEAHVLTDDVSQESEIPVIVPDQPQGEIGDESLSREAESVHEEDFPETTTANEESVLEPNEAQETTGTHEDSPGMPPQDIELEAAPDGAKDDVASSHSEPQPVIEVPEGDDLSKSSQFIADENNIVGRDVQSPVVEAQSDEVVHSPEAALVEQDSDVQSEGFVLVQKDEDVPAESAIDDIQDGSTTQNQGQTDHPQQDQESQPEGLQQQDDDKDVLVRSSSQQEDSTISVLSQESEVEGEIAPTEPVESHLSEEPVTDVPACEDEEALAVAQSEIVPDESPAHGVDIPADELKESEQSPPEELTQDDLLQEPSQLPDSTAHPEELTEEASPIPEDTQPQPSTTIEPAPEYPVEDGVQEPVSTMDLDPNDKDLESTPRSAVETNPDESLPAVLETAVSDSQELNTFEEPQADEEEAPISGSLHDGQESAKDKSITEAEGPEYHSTASDDLHSLQQSEAAERAITDSDLQTTQDATGTAPPTSIPEESEARESSAIEDSSQAPTTLKPVTDEVQDESKEISEEVDNQLSTLDEQIGILDEASSSNAIEEPLVPGDDQVDHPETMLEAEDSGTQLESQEVHISTDHPGTPDMKETNGNDNIDVIEGEQETTVPISEGDAITPVSQAEQALPIEDQSSGLHEEAIVTPPLLDSIGEEPDLAPLDSEPTQEEELKVEPEEIVSHNEAPSIPATEEPLSLATETELSKHEESPVESQAEQVVSETSPEDQPRPEPDSVDEPAIDIPSSLGEAEGDATPSSPQPSLDNEAVTPTAEIHVLEGITDDIPPNPSYEEREEGSVPEGSVEPVISAAVVEPETRDISESGLDSGDEDTFKSSFPESEDHVLDFQPPIDTASEPVVSQVGITEIAIEKGAENTIEDVPAESAGLESSLLDSSQTPEEHSSKELGEAVIGQPGEEVGSPVIPISANEPEIETTPSVPVDRLEAHDVPSLEPLVEEQTPGPASEMSAEELVSGTVLEDPKSFTGDDNNAEAELPSLPEEPGIAIESPITVPDSGELVEETAPQHPTDNVSEGDRLEIQEEPAVDQPSGGPNAEDLTTLGSQQQESQNLEQESVVEEPVDASIEVKAEPATVYSEIQLPEPVTTNLEDEAPGDEFAVESTPAQEADGAVCDDEAEGIGASKPHYPEDEVVSVPAEGQPQTLSHESVLGMDDEREPLATQEDDSLRSEHLSSAAVESILDSSADIQDQEADVADDEVPLESINSPEPTPVVALDERTIMRDMPVEITPGTSEIADQGVSIQEPSPSEPLMEEQASSPEPAPGSTSFVPSEKEDGLDRLDIVLESESVAEKESPDSPAVPTQVMTPVMTEEITAGTTEGLGQIPDQELLESENEAEVSKVEDSLSEQMSDELEKSVPPEEDKALLEEPIEISNMEPDIGTRVNDGELELPSRDAELAEDVELPANVSLQGEEAPIPEFITSSEVDKEQPLELIDAGEAVETPLLAQETATTQLMAPEDDDKVPLQLSGSGEVSHVLDPAPCEGLSHEDHPLKAEQSTGPVDEEVHAPSVDQLDTTIIQEFDEMENNQDASLSQGPVAEQMHSDQMPPEIRELRQSQSSAEPLQSQQQDKPEETPISSDFPTQHSLEELQAEPDVTPPPVESVRELITSVLEAVQEGEQPGKAASEPPVGSMIPTDLEGNNRDLPAEKESLEQTEFNPVLEATEESAVAAESPIIPPAEVYGGSHDYYKDQEVSAIPDTHDVAADAKLSDEAATPEAVDHQQQSEDGIDGDKTHAAVSRDVVAGHSAPETPEVEARDFGQIHQSTITEPHQEELPSQPLSEDLKSISSTELDSLQAVDEHAPLSESFTFVDKQAPADRSAPIDSSQERPGMPHNDSGTQTEDLFRPKTPLQSLMRAAMSQEFRAPTPAIEIPDSEDPHAKQMSRARSVRRQRRRTIRNAEEIVAAAVVIYAAAEALSPPGSPPLASNLDKDLNKEEEPVVLSLSDSTSQGVVVENSTGEEDALRKSVADLLAEDKSRELKSDDKAPKSPHSSRRSSHHSSRSTRSRDGSKDSTAKVPHHHHHHKRRADSEHSGRSGSEQGSPRTPKRQDSGFSSSHSARSKKERSPEEQAAHDKRKEERRLAREKERLKDSSPSKSPSKSSKGKEPDTDKTSSHRSSRRHSHASATVTKEVSPVPPKKFFDMKNGQSVLQSNFSSGVDKEIARPEIPQRANTTRSAKSGVRKSVDVNRAKLQKAREEVAAEAKESTAAESSDAGPGDAAGAGDEHRKNRQEKRQKEGSKDHNKPGFRAAIKRFFTS